MRSLSAALLFVGCVVAGSIQPYSWTPSKEYTYKYSAQVMYFYITIHFPYFLLLNVDLFEFQLLYNCFNQKNYTFNNELFLK